MGRPYRNDPHAQVNLKLFTPAPNKRKTVLLFVFRDRTRTPLARLIETWEEDLRQMWAAITKPPDYDRYSFTDFFEVGMVVQGRWPADVHTLQRTTLPALALEESQLCSTEQLITAWLKADLGIYMYGLHAQW